MKKPLIPKIPARKKSHQVRYERFHAFVDSLPEFEFAPKTWQFWRDSFLIFLLGSFIGHVFEMILWLGLVNQNPDWQLPWMPFIAEPFGLGALAIIWFIYPLVKSHKVGVFGAFVSGAFVATAVEFLCAATIVAILGHNPYWDYSTVTQFNLFGFVCLHNALGFGLGALVYIYFFFPWFDKWLDRLGKAPINVIAIALVAWYVASRLSQLLFGFPLFL